MQRKLCRLRLQQMCVWLLWQYLHAEEKFDTKKFSKPDSRGERPIHEIRQHVQEVCKWLCGYVYSLQEDKQNRYGGWRPEVLYDVTYYDLFSWIHYYAARDTILPNDKKESDIDFANDGQGFPSWHRLYLLAWERTLQEVGNDEEFALPFWDWTGNPNQCDPAICSKELLGVTDQTTGTVKGDYFND